MVPPAQPASATAPSSHQQFQFTGDGGEYFRIWIVNLLLSILTLGIYSAWAKVRRLRYFYGNTRVAGSAFQYHAQPMQILKGRLIAFGFFVLYSLTTQFAPLVALLLALLFLIFLPWIVVRALRFRARMSSYRNIRLSFANDVGGAARVYIGLSLLVPLTLGILFPYFDWARHRFAIANTGYGQTPFGFNARAGTFYGIYLRALGFLLLAIVAIVVLGFLFGLGNLAAGGNQAGAGMAMMVLIVPAYLVGLLLLAAYVNKSIQNATLGNTTLADHRFHSNMETGPLFWLYLSNTLLIVVTLGLFTPWAQVRMARYRYEHLALEVRGSLDEFVAAQAPGTTGATGEEMSEMFDVELGV